MSKIAKNAQNKNWKETAVEVYLTTPKKNGKVQWTEIAKKVSAVHKDVFNGCKDPSKKLQDAFRSAAIKEMIASAAMTSAEEPKKVPVKMTTTKKVTDSSETVIHSADVVEESKDKDGSNKYTVDVLLNGELGKLSEAEILEMAHCDPEKFKLLSFTCRKGIWQTVSTEEGVIELRSARVNITAKPVSVGEVTYAEVVNSLTSLIEKREKAGKSISVASHVEEDADKIAIVSVADLHLGKLAWGPECGESYDHKIARKRFNHIINTSIDRLKKENGIEKIIFFWSQDFFHFDSAQRF